MPQYVDWLIQERVLLMCLVGPAKPAEIKQLSNTITHMMNEQDVQHVHVLVDITRMTSHSINAADYGGISFANAAAVGWVVIIGSNAMIRFLANIITGRATQRDRGVRTTFVKDHTAAIQFLVDADASLTADELQRALTTTLQSFRDDADTNA